MDRVRACAPGPVSLSAPGDKQIELARQVTDLPGRQTTMTTEMLPTERQHSDAPLPAVATPKLGPDVGAGAPVVPPMPSLGATLSAGVEKTRKTSVGGHM